MIDVTVAISCLTCDNFSIDFGVRGYGEYTPGNPASIYCEKSGEDGCAWPDDDVPDGTPTLITIAERCKHYRTRLDLQPRGV